MARPQFHFNLRVGYSPHDVMLVHVKMADQFGVKDFTVDKSPSDKDTLTNCAIVSRDALPGIK